MAIEPHSDVTDKQTGGVTISNIIGGIHDSIIGGRDVIIQIFAGSSDEQRTQRNRRAMLELVKNTWIKGVLEQSLHGAAMIELGLEERADAVEHPWDMVLQMLDRPNRSLSPGKKIVGVFDEMGHSLLILGEPGSGKTTMLLELARDTIARAEGDPTQPIPVVFNLSSWAEKCQPIADWLVNELNSKYDIPKKIARPWVENDELSLLLDGLDEVKPEHREASVKAINAFRQEHLTPIVVCSRIADYEALITRLRLQGAVLLQPLTPEQIGKYLEGVGIELLAVRRTLQHDSTLQELVQSPLMLSVMTLAYRGMSVEDLGSFDLIETHRRHVLDTYVQRMFERRRAGNRYSRRQTTRWLVWLAQEMSQHGQTVFLIERMQPSWLRTSAQHWLYVIVFGLSMMLFGTIFAGGISFSQVAPIERLKWSWKKVREQLIIVLGLGLAFGLAFWMISGLRVGLSIGLSVGLSMSLMSVLVSGLINVEIETRLIPNHGIWQSARNAVIIVLSIWLIFGSVWLVSRLGGGMGRELIIVPISGLMFGLTFGLLHGGAAFIQHFILRFILYCNGHIPWNYARFLDYAAERIFLRKVGGGYIFVHRLLMEYFASLEPEQVE